MKIEIESMKPEHIEQVYSLEQACFSTPWSLESLFGELDNTRARYFVALDAERVIGYAGYWQIVDEGHITNIAVDSGYRRAGVGSALIGAMLDAAHNNGINMMSLEVRAGNTGAQRFYAKFKFMPVGVRKGYYTEPDENAVIMIKKLSAE